MALEEQTVATDYMIIGSGIMGLALAREIRQSEPADSQRLSSSLAG